MYMHIAARGDATRIATTIHDALGRTGTPLGTPAPPGPATPVELDTTAIATALGVTGKDEWRCVYQVSRRFPRK